MKDHNGVTGNGGETVKLDEILGHRPASVPFTLLHTGSSSAVTAEAYNSDAEGGETGGINDGKKFKCGNQYYCIIHDLDLLMRTDGSDIQVPLSVDSTLLPPECA